MVIFLLSTPYKINAQVYQRPSCIQAYILSLQATSSDSCNNSMDFYGSMSINGKSLNFSHIIEGNFIRPPWSVRTTSVYDYNEVVIKIYDEDDGFCGGKDDEVDINPENNLTFLVLSVVLRTGRIFLITIDPNNPSIPVGNVGQPFVLHGYRGAETASITIQVDYIY